MDRLAALFEHFTLPEIARLLRRTVFAAVGVGIVALGVSIGLSHPLVGLGLCLGLGGGLFNIRLVTRSVAKVNAQAPAKPTRVLASRTLGRLGMTTAVVIALMFASVSLGLGAAGGVAIFYLLLIVNLVQALLHRGPTGVAA